MKKKIITIFLLLVFLAGAGFLIETLINKKQGEVCFKNSCFKVDLAAVASLIKALIVKKEGEVCFKNSCFKVELAVTQKELARGLMSRKSLAENGGMLFIFNREEEYNFWMKNMLIPLDIIWINQKGEVVYISKNAQPCSKENCPSINPGKKALYALELKSGKAKKINLTVGDKAELKIPNF